MTKFEEISPKRAYVNVTNKLEKLPLVQIMTILVGIWLLLVSWLRKVRKNCGVDIVVV